MQELLDLHALAVVPQRHGDEPLCEGDLLLLDGPPGQQAVLQSRSGLVIRVHGQLAALDLSVSRFQLVSQSQEL